MPSRTTLLPCSCTRSWCWRRCRWPRRRRGGWGRGSRWHPTSAGVTLCVLRGISPCIGGLQNLIHLVCDLWAVNCTCFVLFGRGVHSPDHHTTKVILLIHLAAATSTVSPSHTPPAYCAPGSKPMLILDFDTLPRLTKFSRMVVKLK